MRKRTNHLPPAYFRLRAAEQDARKAANVISKALELGRAIGAAEVERGACDSCGAGRGKVDGARRFQPIKHEYNTEAPARSFIHRLPSKLCGVCLVKGGHLFKANV